MTNEPGNHFEISSVKSGDGLENKKGRSSTNNVGGGDSDQKCCQLLKEGLFI